jgi:hypothetical protein
MTTELSITVQCVSCKKKKTLRGDEIPKGDMPPFCDSCYSPMVAEKAEVKRFKDPFYQKKIEKLGDDIDRQIIEEMADRCKEKPCK